MVLEHPTYKELQEKLTEEEKKSLEFKNQWLRSQADLENFKKRSEKDIANAHKYGIEKFALEVLNTVDNLERGLAVEISEIEDLKNFHDGIEMTLKSLLDTLQKFDIAQIDPVGQEFDHEKHTAITTREDGGSKPNTVLEVIQKGYWFKDRLLRPALVVVSK